jgi:eukaryotic-like serine/threonine-protein kinase
MTRLEPGMVLGQYRVGELLGAGGMGEVYRAHDSTLGRDVAIKVLRADLAADGERLARLGREARVLASLSHPNVAAIFGVIEAPGAEGAPRGPVRALVLELVEGPTLAERLAAGPLSLTLALTTARQIADALEAAHAKGIVHRDLKPANIKITPEGLVKVLDLGLAKAVGAESGAGSTTLEDATRSGIILGTFAYMSPEQARGLAVDKRTDIWSFGCVLYEMLTGRTPFHGGTPTDLLAKIVERDPDWNDLPTSVPPSIRTLLRRCLAKDASERLHDIADARIEIADALARPVAATAPPRRPASAARALSWTALAAAIVIGLTWAAPFVRGRSAAVEPMEFRVDLADNAGYGIATAPDGRHIAFAVCCGGPQLWVYSLASGEAHAIPGTDGAKSPFWSPDSATIGFVSDTGVRTVDLRGGPPATISQVKVAGGGTWNRDGVILVSNGTSLLRVPSSGGAPLPLRMDTPQNAVITHPVFLSDNRHFIYHLQSREGGAIRLGSLDGPETRLLAESELPGIVADSSLLFVRGTALVKQRLNSTTFALEGPVSLVVPNAAPGFLGTFGERPQFSASTTGVLAVVKTRGGTAGELTWFDRVGRPAGTLAQSETSEYVNPAISPQGDRVAVNRMDPETGNWDVWIVDVGRKVASRLTSDAARDADAVWSPDGRQVAFESNRGGHFGVYRKAVDGASPEEPVWMFDGVVYDLIPTDWSPDGSIFFNVSTQSHPNWTLWKVNAAGNAPPVPVAADMYNPYDGRVSADGRWVAYSSFETGTAEIYVERLMPPAERHQVTTGGGTHPRWVSEGRELVYWPHPHPGLASVALDLTQPRLHLPPSHTLLSTSIPALIDSRTHYDVTRDGQRLLVRQAAGTQRPAMTVIVNWPRK